MRTKSPFKVPAVPSPPSSGRLRDEEPLPRSAEDLDESPSEAETPHRLEDLHRPQEPTLVATPAIEWEPALPSTYPPPSSGPSTQYPPTPTANFYPSNEATPAAPRKELPSNRSMEASLRDQIWSGLGPQTGPQPSPISAPAPVSSGSLPASTGTGSYPSASGERDIAVPRPPATPAPGRDGMPTGYIVASAFFLAIAVVGFGLWLAFEVISF